MKLIRFTSGLTLFLLYFSESFAFLPRRVIHEVLSPHQGLSFDPENHESFGYISALSTSFANLYPDMPIQSSKSPIRIPKKTLAVLSSITYVNSTAPIELLAYTSVRNGKIAESTFKIDYPISVQFNTYSFDEKEQSWFVRLISGENYPRSSILRGRLVSSVVNTTSKEFGSNEEEDRIELRFQMRPEQKIRQSIGFAQEASGRHVNLPWFAREGLIEDEFDNNQLILESL